MAAHSQQKQENIALCIAELEAGEVAKAIPLACLLVWFASDDKDRLTCIFFSKMLIALAGLATEVNTLGFAVRMAFNRKTYLEWEDSCSQLDKLGLPQKIDFFLEIARVLREKAAGNHRYRIQALTAIRIIADVVINHISSSETETSGESEE